MADKELKTIVEDFIQKYDSGEKKLRENANGTYIYLDTIRHTLPDALAETILEYRKVNKNPSIDSTYEYHRFRDALNNCLKVIEYANAHNMIEDQNTVKKLKEFETKCKSLEEELKKCETFRDDLIKQRDYWKTRHDLLTELLPKKHDEVFESDVKDG